MRVEASGHAAGGVGLLYPRETALIKDRRPVVARTDEQLDFATRLETLIRPVLGERVRLVPDAEGFPIVPGRLGRIEYLGTRHGPDRDGRVYTERLHVYSAGAPSRSSWPCRACIAGR